MKYSLYGMGATMTLIMIIASAAAMDRANYKPAKGTVSTIDRTCNFIETTTTADGHRTARGLTDSCNSTDEWDKAREEALNPNGKRISGEATMHVSYTAPQDGSYRTADLHFTGGDDEFYKLQAGDQVDILVSDKDPGQIRKA